MLRSLTFLWNIISIEGVDVDPRNTEAVKNWLRPLTQTGIRIFLGLTSYYRRFVDGFMYTPSLLTTLTQKSKKFFIHDVGCLCFIYDL